MTAQQKFETDVLSTSDGDLQITFLGHGSLMFTFKGMHFYVDPFSRVADYSQLPQADVILLTHEHGDHLDPQALKHIRTEETVVVMTETCGGQISGNNVLRNGEKCTVKGVQVEAVPAYNLVHRRPNGQPFHPKGVGNGYVLAFGDKRVYVAGDTENIPEMKDLAEIEVAFLPMNLPYTMTPEMVAQASRSFRPRIVYPYHYGDTDPSLLAGLLEDEQDIEVRIRKLA